MEPTEIDFMEDSFIEHDDDFNIHSAEIEETETEEIEEENDCQETSKNIPTPEICDENIVNSPEIVENFENIVNNEEDIQENTNSRNTDVKQNILSNTDGGELFISSSKISFLKKSCFLNF